jgi:hypothetical protein
VADRGWNLGNAELRQVVLLRHVAEHGSGSSFAKLPAEAGEVGSDMHASLVADLELFEGRGWIQLARDMGGGCDARLLSPGRAELERLQALYDDLPGRFAAARDALLHWLNECELTPNERPQISAFFTTRYSYFHGQHFGNDEINKASRYLKDLDLIDGEGGWGGGIPRPRITTKGQLLVQSGRSVNDPQPPPSGGDIHLTINQHGDYAVAQAAGHGAVQSFTQSTVEDYRQQILGFAGALEELIRAKDLHDASELPNQIRSAAESNDQGTIARVLGGTRDYLEQHASTGLGALVLIELANLMQAIGLS